MKRMKRWLTLGACLVVLSASSADAQMSFLYGGVHPIHPAVGGGFCYVAGPHSHPYGIDPNISYLYRVYNGYHYFVGDPYHFGYQGQAFAYYGHHPLHDYGSYCYLDGPHHHHFLPAAAYVASYLVNNGYYYYNGVLPPYYYTYRPIFYRRRHTFWYLPVYRTYYRTYHTYWRRYATPASIVYIRQPPRIVYRYTTPPPVRRWTRTITRTVVRPAYRYNVYRPRTYGGYYRRPVVRTTTTTTVRRGPTVYRTTTTRTWRRR